MQTATLIISPETIRQTLQAEKDHWIKLKRFFNVNHELVETFAGEQLYNVGCFAGLMSFITSNTKYKAANFAEFMTFEKKTLKYFSTVIKLDNISALSQQQLNAIYSYFLRRGELVERLVEEVFYNISNLPAPDPEGT